MRHYDDHLTTKASEQDKTASDITTTTSGREQLGQDENISSPAERDQNHENVCVVGATKNQHEVEARNGSQDQDQNYGQKGHPKRANEKQGKDIKRTNQKSMTYREALLGLDNSEPSSEDNSEPSSDF